MPDYMASNNINSAHSWNQSLGLFVDSVVSKDPDKIFIEIAGQSITYHEFQERSIRAASMFRSLGIVHGDRVCLYLPNCPEFLYCWFGLSRIGAISVPINTAYKRDETAYILNNSGAVAVIGHSDISGSLYEAAELSPNVKFRLAVRTPESDLFDSEWCDFNTLLNTTELSDLSDLSDSVSPSDISMLVYTSGTTGNPKGVQVTQKMYVAAGQGFSHWTNATSDDRFFTCLPYFHANAQYYSTMGALSAGATLIVSDRFSASRFWDQVRESRATVVNFIGMMMPVLSKQPKSESDLDNMVRLFYGSPAFSPEFLDEFKERFGTEIIVGFGMTETCYGTIETIGENRRANSSGLPRRHPDPEFKNNIRIVDEEGDPVASSIVGEITISNPVLMTGYWKNVEQTELALRDGWLFTGDLGWLDEDGYLYFVDRKKDVIRRRGENISSQEVEDVIKRHPYILDCAVISVPSELGEDDVKAYVLPQDGHDISPEEIIYWCANLLAYFKVPRYIEMREDLPRTPSLRVRKDVLRSERDDLIIGCFDSEAAGIKLR
ncbi:MAG: ATP-dependent acyl-CoA ligase [Chloroflexota bacterium]|nr:ATP-dependent acyl-CoA ligase [Chloroflexota bacterium]